MVKKKLKLYLAGPMRGQVDLNFPEFMKAEKLLRKMGHDVWNPARVDVERDKFNPKTDTPRPIKEYMARDLAALCKCDGIALLPGWEKSRGAMLEAMVANALGLSLLEIHLKGCGLSISRLENRSPKELEQDGWQLAGTPEKEPEKSILMEAESLVNGPRQALYGPPAEDFARTARLWTALLWHKLKGYADILPRDVAWMMMLLKASRAQHSNKRDHYTDAAGYAACGWMCVKSETEGAC